MNETDIDRLLRDFESRSVSARVHGSVPGVINMAAPAAIPNRTESVSDQSRFNPTVIAAQPRRRLRPRRSPLALEWRRIAGFLVV